MSDKNQVSVEEFRANLADLIGRVMYGKERVVVTKYNREAAVVLSPEEYKRLLDPAKRFTKKEWDEKFEQFEKVKKRISSEDQEALAKDIKQAIREVRAIRK